LWLCAQTAKYLRIDCQKYFLNGTKTGK